MCTITNIGYIASEAFGSDRMGVVDVVFDRSVYIDFNDTLVCLGLDFSLLSIFSDEE